MLKNSVKMIVALSLSTACTTIPLQEDYRAAREKTVGAFVGDLPPVEYDNSTGSGDQLGLIGALITSAVEAVDSAVRSSDDKVKEVAIVAEDSQAFRENIRRALEADKAKVTIFSAGDLQTLPRNTSQRSDQAEMDFTSLQEKKVAFALIVDGMRLGIFGRKQFQPCLFAEASIVRVSDNVLMFRDRFESCATAPEDWRDGDVPQIKAMILTATQVFTEQLKQKLAEASPAHPK